MPRTKPRRKIGYAEQVSDEILAEARRLYRAGFSWRSVGGMLDLSKKQLDWIAASVDIAVPRLFGARNFSHCHGCGYQVQKPCFVCASRKLRAQREQEEA